LDDAEQFVVGEDFKDGALARIFGRAYSAFASMIKVE